MPAAGLVEYHMRREVAWTLSSKRVTGRSLCGVSRAEDRRDFVLLPSKQLSKYILPI